MGMIKTWFRNWMLDNDQSERSGTQPALVGRDGDRQSLSRTFTIVEALNGSYITFTKHRYNPNGPDDYRHEVYLVQDGESLIDAISTVLVLTEK
jgi:hypothetical protein